MKYFGYGYIKDAKELVPSIPICFYAFRLMVGVGCLLILFFALSLFLVYKKESPNTDGSSFPPSS